MHGPRAVEVVGVLGWGRMGSAIGGHLCRAGWPVVATDPAPHARTDLARVGAQLAEDPEEVAAASDLVVVIVVDDEQVRDVVLGPNGVLRAARPGTICAIAASVKPSTCRELANAAARSEVHVIDAALVGGERGAETGDLLILAAGSTEAIDACRPAFRSFARDVAVLGDVGAGQVAKIVNNLLLWAAIRIDAEALQLARALGVDTDRVRSAVALGTGANRPLAEWGLHRLRWPRKDIEVALSLADEQGLDMPFVRRLADLIDDLTIEYPQRTSAETHNDRPSPSVS